MDIRKGIVRPFAERFFAGETMEDALEHARRANAQGMGVTLDYLGEDVAGFTEALEAQDEFERLLAAVSEKGLDCSLAIKLTHIGLGLDRSLAFAALKSLGAVSEDMGIRLWLDMEGSEHTDDTIEAYRMLKGVNPDSGLALQASLWRTWEDLTALVAEGARIRLVKGAYREPDVVAASRPAEIRTRFIDMMMYLFAHARAFAIGTHDKAIIDAALRASKDVHMDFEFQMLMGMRDDLKLSLVGEGRRVVEYVPYGEDWYGYGMRRLMEQRRNVLRFAEALAGR
jgi:proline dehydrogenase